MRRRRRRTIRVRLPELTTREAAALTYLLDQLQVAMWFAYDPQMSNLCEREGIPLIATDSEHEQTTDRKRGR
jgi:hypothetical protein